MTKFTYFKK